MAGDRRLSELKGPFADMNHGSADVDPSSARYQDLLPFSLEPFCRMAWASSDARTTWQNQFSEIRRFVVLRELNSISERLRSSGLFAISNADHEHFLSLIGERGLIAIQIGVDESERIRTWAGNFNAVCRPLVYFAVMLKGVRDSFTSAWTRQDHVGLGQLLGIPPCCLSVQGLTVEIGRYRDTTWMSACSTKTAVRRARECQCDIAPRIHSLLDSMGFRMVPHRLCRFDCEESLLIASRMRSMGGNDTQKVRVQLDELFEWPIEWSALHGIAVIKTPVFQLCMDTDATGAKYSVKLCGSRHPVAAACGLTFPYIPPGQFLPSQPETDKGKMKKIRED